MKYDLHVHSYFSHDSINNPKNIVKFFNKKHMGFAITDHNTCHAWPKLYQCARAYGVPLIFGEEIRVFHNKEYLGEFIGYFMNEPVEPGEYTDVLDALRQQDAIISLAHPFDLFRKPFFKSPFFSDTHIRDTILRQVHAIEGFNSRAALKSFNKRAVFNAHFFRKALSGGSDAHLPEELGRGYTITDGNSVEELRKALRTRRTHVGGHRSNPLVHLFSTIAKHTELMSDPDVIPPVE